MSGLRKRLEDGYVHVMDGAMGTMLYQRGVFVNLCYDELNLNRPELVRGVHEAYVRAGAEILELHLRRGRANAAANCFDFLARGEDADP